MGGPVLAGTRIAVGVILGMLAAGASMESIMSAYHVGVEQLRAAFGYAADRLAAEATYVVPVNP